MYEIVEATYSQGQLVLDLPTDSFQEGQRLKLIIINDDAVQQRKQRFFDHLTRHTFTLPTDYTFDREALYER